MPVGTERRKPIFGGFADEDRLNYELAARGWSIRDLAHECGISEVTLSNIRSGKHTARAETARRVMAAFKRTPIDPDLAAFYRKPEEAA